MALRFRRTLKIMPGVRLNLGKRGVSVSAGVRGANVTLGQQGLYGNVGLTGTGLSYREKLLKKNKASVKGRAPQGTIAAHPLIEKVAQITVNPVTGDIQLLDTHGALLDGEVLALCKKQAKRALIHAVKEQVELHNKMMQCINKVHVETPTPSSFPLFIAEPFTDEEPVAPTNKKPNCLTWLIPSRKKAWYAAIDQEKSAYTEAHSAWLQKKNAHEKAEEKRQKLYNDAKASVNAALEAVLQDHLQDIDWPRETELTFELSANSTTLLLDVDLPEIEDFPTTELQAYQRGIGVSVKSLSDTAIRQMYMEHVHGMGFRLIGEGFATVPPLQRVILSAFTQVTDSTTGTIKDKYLYSVKVSRTQWQKIIFSNLNAINPVDALGAFELRRDMSKTGIFKEIVPFEK